MALPGGRCRCVAAHGDHAGNWLQGPRLRGARLRRLQRQAALRQIPLHGRPDLRRLQDHPGDAVVRLLAGANLPGEFSSLCFSGRGIDFSDANGCWQNATTNKTAIEVGVDCGSGCLFNIRDDPSEYSDLAQANPAKLAELRERFFALNSTAFHQLKLPQDEGLCSSYVQAHHGYVGPYLAGI